MSDTFHFCVELRRLTDDTVILALSSPHDPGTRAATSESVPGSPVPFAPWRDSLVIDAFVATTAVPVPGVDGAMMLTDVLSQTECREILGSAEAVGFHPDQPIADRSASVLAHNLYWLADEVFWRTLSRGSCTSSLRNPRRQSERHQSSVPG